MGHLAARLLTRVEIVRDSIGDEFAGKKKSSPQPRFNLKYVEEVEQSYKLYLQNPYMCIYPYLHYLYTYICMFSVEH